MMATTAITEDTPIRIPSTVRKERSLLLRREATAMATASLKGIGSFRLPPGQVALDAAVANVDGAVGVVGDVLLVGDQDDGVAFRVQPLEEGHDLVAGGGVQVSGGLV